MGNVIWKSPLQDTLDFISKENRKWTGIITNFQNRQPLSIPWDTYIESEMRSTEQEWRRMSGMHGYQSPAAIRTGHEEELKKRGIKISKLTSEKEYLQQQNYRLEKKNREDSKELLDFKRENSALKKKIQHANAVPQSHSNPGQDAQGNKISHEAAQKVTLLQKQIAEKDDEVQILKANNESLEMHVKFVEEEKAALLHRLSKMAGDRLLDNNPAIADLSDPNRPTKLGEFYGELYDNEWTNSFAKLHNSGYEEDDAAETLQLTLMNVFKFCEMKAGMVLKQAVDAVNLLFEEYKQSMTDMPKQSASAIGKVTLQGRWKAKNTDAKTDKSESNKTLMSYGMVQGRKKERVKAAAESKLIQLRKEVAVSMVPIVQEAYLEANWNPDCLEEIKPFIMKCLNLSWIMVAQSPPMALATCETGDRFDNTKFKYYTKSGSVVDYMVWPALLLEKDGPVVAKGVAEGK